jgi:translation initiation factor 3 subunit M
MERVAEPYSSTFPPLRSLSPTADLLATVASQLSVMAVDTENQVFIDGTFEDLAEELAAYIDNIKKVDEDTGLRSEVGPLLKANKKDDVLKKLVTASPVLNAAPEKEFTAAYNLLVYLVVQSPNVNMFLPKVCENLSRPITSSPINGPGLALSVLTTLFNLLRPDNEVRFNVFQAILRLVKTSGLFEMLRPQLAKVDTWIEQWDIDEEDQRKLFGQIADIAEDAGEEELVPFTLYSRYLLTFPSDKHTSTYYAPFEHSTPKILKKSLLPRRKTSPFERLDRLSSLQHTMTFMI